MNLSEIALKKFLEKKSKEHNVHGFYVYIDENNEVKTIGCEKSLIAEYNDLAAEYSALKDKYSILKNKFLNNAQ